MVWLEGPLEAANGLMEPGLQDSRIYHKIDISNARLIYHPSHRLLLAKQAEVNKMLKDMEEQTVIEELDSPWFPPTVLVWKKNRDLPFFLDYRKMNDATKKDCFPLPRIDNTLDTLAETK
jgi:hypothetical protein